ARLSRRCRRASGSTSSRRSRRRRFSRRPSTRGGGCSARAAAKWRVKRDILREPVGTPIGQTARLVRVFCLTRLRRGIYNAHGSFKSWGPHVHLPHLV